MFRLSRNRPAKSGDRVEFRFSNFKALQVPKGWDKLFVSIISVETGKTIIKSSKALVRNGSCEWTDTLSESIWSPQNDSSKEVEDCLFKFVVSMGSARSGILGETTINMTAYMSSTASVSVSLPLKKNNHGTVLQVMIHCMAQTTKVRDGELKESNSHVEDPKVDSHLTDAKSEVSDSTSPQSVMSSFSNGRSSASLPGEPESRQTSFSASGSHDSYDSVDVFLSREALSPTTTNISGNRHNLRQDSSTSHGNYLADDASQTHHSSFPSPTSLLISTSSKNLLEAAEDTIEELRAEAKMWERNARKLMLDLDTLRSEFLDQSKDQANLEMELSATRAECAGLIKEVERLKLLSEKSTVASSSDDSATHLRKELENEIKMQRESSADLAMQFKRSQESNIELVSLLQELELEKSNMEKSLLEKTEENLELSVQLQQVQELEKNLQAKVLILERALEDKGYTVEAKLSESSDGGDANLITEMEAMKEKVQELERDCNELTDENLELLFKLKELNNNSTGLCSSCTNLNTKLHEEIDDDHDVSVQELESKLAELGTELDDRQSEIEKLKADLLSKVEGIAELESKVADLEKENINLEENMKAVAKESDITSKCLNGLQNDLVMLSSSVGTHVSANKMLERKSSELQIGRSELKLRLLELEEENEQLVGCISGLEAQIRHLTDESESGRLELDHFKSVAQNLQDEMEIQNSDLKQKLLSMQRRCSEVEEEGEYQRGTNQELKETAEKVIEECNSLQKLNGELGEKNVELEAKCVKLEAKSRESSKKISEYSEKAVVLEENLSSALENFDAKEKNLTSELDALLEENRQLVAQETLFNEMYLEKSMEADNLHEEVQHLTEKVSAAYDERDRTISKAMEERGKLEAYVQEAESKLKHTESDLIGLRAELSASKQNQAKLIADHEKVLNLLQNYRSSEEDFKNAVSNLELKLTVCEYERKQLLEETTNLKGQMQKMELLHDEVLACKNELAATIFDKEKLEASLHRVLGEHEELKAENTSLVGELEDCKCSRVALEEKLLQLERDLMEKEADLRNELNRISRTSSQFQRKIQQLEKDKDECLTKNHTLEDELKFMKEERQNQRVARTNAKVSPVRDDMKFPKNEMAKSPKSPIHHRDSRRKSFSKNDQVQEPTRNRQKPHNIDHHKEGSNGSIVHDQPVNSDSSSKIKLLEDELAKAMEANKTFKAQLNRLMSEGQSQQGEVVAKERFERTKSSLETELKDIRERYLHMSLQYAEVEAQREELVMKLRAAKNSKRWFS